MPLSLDSKQAEAMSADEADSGWSARILAHGRAGAGVLRRLSDDAFEFVHATPRLARLTRLPVRRGSSLRQLAPWLEQEWYDRLNRIARDTRTYINGIPYPVAVQGSFMVFGLDKNPQKREILRVLKKFK